MKRHRIVLAVAFVVAALTGCGPKQEPAAHVRGASADPPVSTADAATPAATEEWTCSMHPQIRMPHPGKCPICGMDLVPVKPTVSGDGSVTLSPGARNIASIDVAKVEKRLLDHVVRAVGRIEFNERRVAYLTARVGGRVERVYADFTGTRVKEGDHLVDLYSPDLTVAQEELLLVSKRKDADPAAIELARQKLLLLGVTKGQLDELSTSGKPSVVLTVFAPIGGTVVEKRVREQSYLAVGDPLYTIADLSTVWLLVDVYEYELPWVSYGQAVEVDVEALPGEMLTGHVAFIEPIVNEMTRTIRVRVELENPGERLKPGMFASARIKARLAAGGMRAVSELNGEYACPMHVDVRAETPGTCPICGMALEKSAATGPAVEPLVALPVTAVLDSGVRKIVWVEKAAGSFVAREVKLGPRAGDFYPVLEGPEEDDLVVVHGNFLLDSQAQILGKPCLLFPAGLVAGEAVATANHAGHAGH